VSTTTQAAAGSPASSLAASAAFGRFVILYALSAPVLYVICELANWPLFTYHPATGRFDLGLAPAVKDEGPAMYWYGWTATTLIGSTVVGLLATVLPQGVVRKFPLSLIWILPLVATPILVYSLRSFWRF
jgi:hypothetical protein